MTRAAIYARVSTERQERAGTIDSQVAQLRALAEADGHVLTTADLYLDDGFSGTTLQRPALERLRDRAFDGLIDVVYVHSPDRLARRYAYQVLLMDELRRRSCCVARPLTPSVARMLAATLERMISKAFRSDRAPAHAIRNGFLS